MTFLQKHAYSFGCAVAAAAWPLFPKRRRISTENILRCGVAPTRREAAKLAKRAWCHFLGHIFEALCVPKVVTRENFREHLNVEGVPRETVELLLEKTDEPILLVSAHHGVWEAATNILSFARPMIAVARVMNNRLLARWMSRHHFRGPVTLVDKNRGFTREILHQWKREAAAMTLLVDQHAGGGLLVSFLGRPARTVTSAARLAIRTGAKVVVGSFVRLAPYEYRLVGGEALSFSAADDVETVTQLLNDRLGAAIKAYPEQYLWAHRRWRDD